MSILKLHHTYENRGYENIPAVAPLKQSKKEGEPSSLTAAADETAARKTDSVEISPEGRLAAVQEKEIQESAAQETEAQEAAAKDSDSPSGKVAVNEGKRARQIAAAQNQGELQQVLALLEKDLSDCKAGLQKGWCDRSEIAKVEALISKARSRMSQVPRKSDQDDAQGGLDAFAMASLM